MGRCQQSSTSSPSKHARRRRLVWTRTATCGRWAFNWFLGENHLQQWLFDPSTGDCRDGLHIDRVNQNQGTRKGIPRSCEASKARAINLYYGAADTSVALAKGSVNQLLHWLDRHDSSKLSGIPDL